MSDITITYETLFEIFRREKDRQDLQKLWPNFVSDVADYVKDKTNILNSDLSNEEKKKLDIQLDNMKRVVKELYEKREKKIVSMALDRSRTRSDIFDTTVMLDKERELFNLLVKVLNKGRNDILKTITDRENVQDVKVEIEQRPSVDIRPSSETTASETVGSSKTEKTTKMVRFLTAVPKFVGPDMEQFGPFKEEDMASLPSKIAVILINKQRAEEITED